MGDRYFLEITCPECGRRDTEIYFAPTCGFVDWKCRCGYMLDLVKYTGITPEMASNKAEIQAEINRVLKGTEVMPNDDRS